MTNEDIAAVELRVVMTAWKALERRWDLSPVERRRLLPAGGEDSAAPPLDTETRVRLTIEIDYRILLADCLLVDWLRTSSSTLGELTPLDAMSGSLGDLRGVRQPFELGFAS